MQTLFQWQQTAGLQDSSIGYVQEMSVQFQDINVDDSDMKHDGKQMINNQRNFFRSKCREFAISQKFNQKRNETQNQNIYQTQIIDTLPEISENTDLKQYTIYLFETLKTHALGENNNMAILPIVFKIRSVFTSQQAYQQNLLEKFSSLKEMLGIDGLLAIQTVLSLYHDDLPIMKEVSWILINLSMIERQYQIDNFDYIDSILVEFVVRNMYNLSIQNQEGIAINKDIIQEIFENIFWYFANMLEKNNLTLQRKLIVDDQQILPFMLSCSKQNILSPNYFSQSFVETVIWLFSKMSAYFGSEKMDIARFEHIVGIITNFLSIPNIIDNIPVNQNLMKSIKNLTSGDLGEIQLSFIVAQLESCLPIIQNSLMRSTDKITSTLAMQNIYNFVAGSEIICNNLIKTGLLDIIEELLKSLNYNIRRESCWACSNILSNAFHSIQDFILHPIYKQFLFLLEKDVPKVKYECLIGIQNMISNLQTKELYHILLIADQNKKTIQCLIEICKNYQIMDSDVVFLALHCCWNALFKFQVKNLQVNIDVSQQQIQLTDGTSQGICLDMNAQICREFELNGFEASLIAMSTSSVNQDIQRAAFTFLEQFYNHQPQLLQIHS